jgi:hypothetical protein
MQSVVKNPQEVDLFLDFLIFHKKTLNSLLNSGFRIALTKSD